MGFEDTISCLEAQQTSTADPSTGTRPARQAPSLSGLLNPGLCSNRTACSCIYTWLHAAGLANTVQQQATCAVMNVKHP